MNRATSTNTLGGAKHSRTRAPLTSFFEWQFESYRMLGAHTMEKLCVDCAKCGGDFRRFIGEILTTHLGMKPPDWLAALIQTSPNATGATWTS